MNALQLPANNPSNLKCSFIAKDCVDIFGKPLGLTSHCFIK